MLGEVHHEGDPAGAGTPYRAWINSQALFLHRCRAVGRLDQVDAGFAVGFVVVALAGVGDFLMVDGVQCPTPLVFFVFVKLEVHESTPLLGAIA